MEQQPEKKQVIFSGIQPSGVLTLGNYIGAVRNWDKMQEILENICAICHRPTGFEDLLATLVSHYGVRTAVGIGNYAYDKLCRIKGLRVLKIPHPSPINPGSRSWWQDDGKAVVDFLKGEGVLR